MARHSKHRQRTVPCGLAALLAAASLGSASAEPAAPAADPTPVEQVMERYRAGDYAAAADQGRALLTADPDNDPLRLAVADSLSWSGQIWPAAEQYRHLVERAYADPRARLELARTLSWSGRMEEAAPHFQALLDGPLAAAALVGLADARRWQGRDDLALALYRATPPDEAVRGRQLLSERKLAPRTRIAAEAETDSSGTDWQATTLRHDWRSDQGQRAWSVRWLDGHLDHNNRQTAYRAVTLSADDPALPGEPRLELTRRVAPEARTLGQLNLRLPATPVRLWIGRIDWGRSSFSGNALERGATARQLGIDAIVPAAIGVVRTTAVSQAIDDGNRVDSAELRLTPWRRPLGPNFRPYVGLFWRNAEQTVADYWSPHNFRTALIGGEGETMSATWELWGFAQLAAQIGDQRVVAFSGGGEARKWWGSRFATGLRAVSQRNAQGGGYRSHQVVLSIDYLW